MIKVQYTNVCSLVLVIWNLIVIRYLDISAFRCSPIWKLYRYRRPFSALYGYLAAVVFNDLPADPQSEAGAPGFRREKKVEDLVEICRGNSNSRVDNFKYDIPVIEQQLDSDLSAGRCGIDGISQQVQTYLPDLVYIEQSKRMPNIEVTADPDAFLPDFVLVHLDHLFPELREIAPLRHKFHRSAVD